MSVLSSMESQVLGSHLEQSKPRGTQKYSNSRTNGKGQLKKREAQMSGVEETELRMAF